MSQRSPSAALARVVAALAASASLALWAVPARSADKPEPSALGAQDASFKASEQATRMFSVVEAKALKGVTKVAVPLFSVEFVTADEQRAETSGFAAAGRASATMAYTLKGVDEADFQAITTTLYERFLADLKGAGMEVLSHEQVAASPSYKKLAASGVASPIKSDSAITTAPPGMPIYGMNKAQTGGTGSGASLFGAFAQMGAGFGAVSAGMDTFTLQQELGAAVIGVQMKVIFVQLTNNNKGFLGRMSSTASVGSTVQPTVATATFSVMSASGGMVSLAQPLALDATAFSAVRKKESSTGEKVGLVAVAVLGALIGSGSTSSRDDWEAVADPVKYREVVAGGLSTVTQMFVQRLKAGE